MPISSNYLPNLLSNYYLITPRRRGKGPRAWASPLVGPWFGPGYGLRPTDLCPIAQLAQLLSNPSVQPTGLVARASPFAAGCLSFGPACPLRCPRRAGQACGLCFAPSSLRFIVCPLLALVVRYAPSLPGWLGNTGCWLARPAAFATALSFLSFPPSPLSGKPEARTGH